jgi:hypothetical protein
LLDHSTIAIGWDVGGWNCDNNAKSRDALIVLNRQAQPLGLPWRGNLRQAINDAPHAAAFLAKIFSLCRIEAAPSACHVTIAIDAPLAFPASLIELLTTGRVERNLGDSATNPYLYRFTERRLATPGNVPLSAVKDMIGSQSTKAIHATTKFAQNIEGLGVWSDGGTTRFIETYPAACRRLSIRAEEFVLSGLVGHDDIIDAGVCALIALRFATAPETLEAPPPDAPASEGWIWLPKARPAQ